LWRIATIAKEAGLKFLSRNYELSSNGHLKTLLKGFVLRHELSTSSVAIITYFDILIMRLILTTKKNMKWGQLVLMPLTLTFDVCYKLHLLNTESVSLVQNRVHIYSKYIV